MSINQYAEYFVCMHISVPSVCLVPMQARIECESLRM